MATKTSGIRFKVEDMTFVQKRENLDTVQKVFTFLMNEYLKLYRIEKKSVYAVNNQIEEKSINIPTTKTEYRDNEPSFIDPFEFYKYQFSESQSIDELTRNVALMKKDNAIMWKQRTALEAFAVQVQQEKGFIFND